MRMVENLKIRISVKRTVVIMSSRFFLTFYIHIFNINEIICAINFKSCCFLLKVYKNIFVIKDAL